MEPLLFSLFKRSLAVCLSFALVATSFDRAGAAAFGASPSSPYHIPAEIGSISEEYHGAPQGHVTLIQDLHINWDAQTHIAQILEHFAKKGVLPEVVGVEGADGTVDASILAAYPNRRIRETVADYFVRQGELTGAGAYAVKTGQSNLLYGVEHDAYYALNKKLFQNTYPARQDLLAQLRGLNAPLTKLMNRHASRAVRQLDGWAARYVSGDVSTVAYTKELLRNAQESRFVLSPDRYLTLPVIAQAGFPNQPSPVFMDHLERELTRLNLDLKAHQAKTPLEKNLVQVESDLHLCERLLDQQLTENELGRFTAQVPEFLRSLRALLDVSASETARIQETIRGAVDYYALAMTREQPMMERAVTLMERSPQRQAVLIAGGFHTAGLVQRLKAQRVSYTVITPRVDSLPDSDHELYTQRLLDHHLSTGSYPPLQASSLNPNAQALATGDWILKDNPLARRIALGRLANAIYHQVRAENPKWNEARIAAELERRLAQHPRVNLTPQKLAAYAHSVAVAPEVEQPRYQKEGGWKFILGHVNRTALDWALRTVGVAWMFSATDPIGAHRLFNLFSPVPLTIYPQTGRKDFDLNLKWAWQKRHSYTDPERDVENLVYAGELVLPLQKGDMLMFPELGTEVQITAETPGKIVRLSAHALKVRRGKGHGDHVTTVYLKVNDQWVSMHDIEPFLRTARDLDEIKVLEAAHWKEAPSGEQPSLEAKLNHYFEVQTFGSSIGPSAVELSNLKGIKVSGDRSPFVTISSKLILRVAPLKDPIDVSFHLVNAEDPNAGAYIQLGDSEGRMRFAPLVSPISQAYDTLEKMNSRGSELQKLDQFGAMYRFWRVKGEPLSFVDAIRKMGRISATTNADAEVYLGSGPAGERDLLGLSLPADGKWSDIILQSHPLYLPGGKPSLYIETIQPNGTRAYHLPDPHLKLGFRTFNSRDGLIKSVFPTYQKKSLKALLERYRYDRDYEESIAQASIDLLNAEPQAVIVKGGSAKLEEVASGEFPSIRVGPSTPDGRYDLTPYLNNPADLQSGVYFEISDNTVYLNHEGRLERGGRDGFEQRARQAKKAEWLPRRLKIYRELYHNGLNVAEAVKVLATIPPTSFPLLRRGVVMGDYLQIRVPFTIGPVTVSVHSSPSGVYLMLVGGQGSVAYAVPTETGVDAYASLEEAFQRQKPPKNPDASRAAAREAELKSFQDYTKWVRRYFSSIMSVPEEQRKTFAEAQQQYKKAILNQGVVSTQTKTNSLWLGEGSGRLQFTLNGVDAGRVATIQAFELADKKTEGDDIYFVVTVNGKKFFVRKPFLEGEQRFQTFDSFEAMKELRIDEQAPAASSEKTETFGEWITKAYDTSSPLDQRTLFDKIVTKGPVSYRTEQNRVRIGGSNRLYFAVPGITSGSKVTIIGHYSNGQDARGGIYFTIEGDGKKFFAQRSKNTGPYFTTYGSYEQMANPYDRGEFHEYALWVSQAHDLNAIPGGRSDMLIRTQLDTAYTQIVEHGSARFQTGNGSLLLVGKPGSVSATFPLGDTPSGKLAIVTADYLIPAEPWQGVYFTVVAEGKTFWIREEFDHFDAYRSLEEMKGRVAAGLVKPTEQTDIPKAIDASAYAARLAEASELRRNNPQIAPNEKRQLLSMYERIIRHGQVRVEVEDGHLDFQGASYNGQSVNFEVPGISNGQRAFVKAQYIDPNDPIKGLYFIVSINRKTFYVRELRIKDMPESGPRFKTYESLKGALERLEGDEVHNALMEILKTTPPAEAATSKKYGEQIAEAHSHTNDPTVKNLLYGALVQKGPQPYRVDRDPVRKTERVIINHWPAAVIFQSPSFKHRDPVTITAHFWNPDNKDEGVYFTIEGTHRRKFYVRYLTDEKHFQTYGSYEEMKVPDDPGTFTEYGDYIIRAQELSPDVNDSNVREYLNDLYAQIVEQGVTRFRTLENQVDLPYADGMRSFQFDVVGVPRGQKAIVKADYLDPSKKYKGVYYTVSVYGQIFWVREVGKEFRTFPTFNAMRDPGGRIFAADSEARPLSDEAKAYGAWVADAMVLRTNTSHATEAPTQDRDRLAQLDQQIVEKGPVQFTTGKGKVVLNTDYLTEFPLKGVGVQPGRVATVSAQRDERGIFFTVDVDGKRFRVRQRLIPGGYANDFLSYRAKIPAAERAKAKAADAQKQKRAKEFDESVKFLSRYKYLDLATALSNNPEELYKDIKVLLEDEPGVTDPPLRKLVMSYVLNLREGAVPPTGVRARVGDTSSVLAALMGLREEIERLGKEKENVFVQTFIKVAFLTIAKNPDDALAEIEAQLAPYPDSPFRTRLLNEVRSLAKEALAFQPSHIRTKMKAHQRAGAWKLRDSIRLAAEGVYGFLLEDDTRLGKTIQFLAAFNPSWKGMVTMPAGVLETWKKEASKHTDGSFRVVAVKGTPEQKRQILAKYRNQKGVLLLISNENLRNLEKDDVIRFKEENGVREKDIKGTIVSETEQDVQVQTSEGLKTIPRESIEQIYNDWKSLNEGLDVVGVDEAQTMENYKGEGHSANSDQAEALHALRPQRFWFMSATPYTSKPDQLFSIMKLIHRDPQTGRVTKPMFATLEAFRAWVNAKGGFSALYVVKSWVSLRRLKVDTGGLYSQKDEIPPAKEGHYRMPVEQSNLVLRIIRNIGLYLQSYNLHAVKPYDQSSIGRFLKLHFMALAQVDPKLLGEDMPTQFWDALDKIVDKQLVQGKKGILVADDKDVINATIAHFQNRTKNPIRVARLDGDVKGYAVDEQGRPVYATYSNGKMILSHVGEPGDRLSAQGYQQYLFNEDNDFPLIVMNARAARGLDLSSGDYQVFLEPPENFVQYYQASDRAMGLLRDPNTPKKIEILRMIPDYDPDVVKAAIAAGEERFVEHGTPAQVISTVVFGVQQDEFNEVVQGIQPSDQHNPNAHGRALMNSLFVDNDPSMKKAKTSTRSLSTESSFYVVWKHLVAKHGEAHNELLTDLVELVEKLKDLEIDTAPLAASLTRYEGMNFEDLRYITALLTMGNKYYRDRLTHLLPEFYDQLRTSGGSIATLAETGPPGLQALADQHPHLVIPFLAASHAWKGSPAGWHVLNDILDSILANGLDEHEGRLAAQRFVHALIPLIDLKDDAFLKAIERYHADLLNEDMSLDDQLTLIEELGVLKMTEPATAHRILTSTTDFDTFRDTLHDSLFRSAISAFDLPNDETSRARLLELSQQWGSLQTPLRLVAKLQSGDPARFGEHVRLFKEAFRHIVAGTYPAWRNDRSGIKFKENEPEFWAAFTKPETVSLGDVTVVAKKQTQAIERHAGIVRDLLLDSDMLSVAVGSALQAKIADDLKNPKDALLELEKERSALGTSRSTASDAEKPNIDVQLRDLALRQKVVELIMALDAARDQNGSSGLESRANAVMQGLKQRLGADVVSSVLYQTLRTFTQNIKNAPQDRTFGDVTVEFTYDPDWIMRRGMLEEDMIDCFNLGGNVNQVATLIDDLISRNKMLALVRVGGRLVSRSIVKVKATRATEGEPVLHIERPLYQSGYAFEDEIAQALRQTKAPAMNVTSITRYQYSSDASVDGTRVYSLGTRAPTEYHESLFSWRLREQAVNHRATVINAKPGATPVVKPPLMTSGLRRLLQRHGQSLPSLWKQSWIAGIAEYKLTKNRALFVRRHHPTTALHRLGLNMGWGAIWAGTLMIPAAVVMGGAAMGLWAPVAMAAAVGVWAVTQRVMNIVTHALIDGVVASTHSVVIKIKAYRAPARELRRLENVLDQSIADVTPVAATSSPASETRDLLSHSPDAPSRSVLSEAYARIDSAA